MSEKLAVREASIPGFYIVDLVLHGDNRGWFKENYQKEKMEALGLPAFDIVQNNVSFNDKRGATRGLHAEPWDKFISVANGSVFGAWVDLRKGPSFGTTFSLEVNPGVAVFVPRGVANGYQTLEDNVVYTYLVNAHWSPEAQYSSVNLFDPVLGITWPIPKEQAVFSDKDAQNPYLQDVTPMEISHG
ncbi:MAG: dTDP-4-dehydrorhamnose 3,5-epimerase family protein [Candidatus Saccharimonas sp.]